MYIIANNNLQIPHRFKHFAMLLLITTEIEIIGPSNK